MLHLLMKIITIASILIIFFGTIFAGQVAPLPEIKKPQRIYIDRQQLYITEGATIYIYSLNNFKLQKKFGKRGEGPGEFKESGEGIYLIFSPDNLQVVSSGRLSIFSREGRFIREQIVSNPRNFEFQSLGDRYVGTSLQVEKGLVYFTINLFDKNFKKLKALSRYRHPFFPSHKPIDPVDLRISTSLVYRNKIFFDDEQGTIHVLDHTGRELHTITHDYKRIGITDIHRTRYLAFWRTDLKAEYNAFRERLKFPDHFPCIRNFHIQDDRIYVITFEESGANSRILIFDLQGKLLKKTWAPLAEINMLIPLGFNYYTIHERKIYILRENQPDEEWELVIENMD